MTEKATFTIGFVGDTGGFQEIDAAVEHTAEIVLHFNQRIVDSYQIIEESQKAFAERIRETGNELSTFNNSDNVIKKQPLPIPLGPLPADNEELFREVEEVTKISIDGLVKALELLKKAEPFINFYLRNASQLNIAFHAIGISIAAIFTILAAPFVGASVGSILILLTALATAFFVIHGGIEQLGKISDFVFKQLKSNLMLTEEEAQNFADRLKEAVESQPDTFPDLPPFEQKVILSPELPPEQQEEFLRENEQLLDGDLGGLLEEKSSEFGKTTSDGILNGIQVAFAGGFDLLGALFPEAQAAELGNEIQQTVENIEVPEIPLDLKLDLNEIEKALPPELLKRLNEAEVISPELDREIQEAARKYLELTGQIEKGTEAQSEFAANTGNTAEEVENLGGELQGAGGAADDFGEKTKNASVVLTGLEVFAADVAANINNSFADLIFNSLKGNFDSLGDLWRNTLDSMLEALSQFLATVISNPIRLSLESFLTGGESGQGLLSGITGLGGSLGLGSSGLFGASGSFTALGALFTGNSAVGFGTTLLGAIPAIGAIAAAAAIAIPIISNLLKKSPRLDLDFDQLRDDAGKSLGVAAQVFQFLDEDVFNNEIFSRSVSRKAGLGLGSELPNVIREAIEGQILAIQDIINQLPAELSAQLNDALLNTSVDIESKVKGDRLLEFDETKKIAEKFQQFIEGDLQARFIFSIREFFVGAFESLGVLSDSAQSFVDQQFEEFQNLSGREENVVSLEEVRREKSKNIGYFEEEFRLAA